MIRQATIADIDRIDQTARKFHAELGWVRKPEIRVAIEHGWLLIDEETGAFVLFRIRKDKVRVINAICVPAGAQRRGLGAQLVNRLHPTHQWTVPNVPSPTKQRYRKYHVQRYLELEEMLKFRWARELAPLGDWP